MADKFVVFRVIRTAGGAGASVPLKLFDNEDAAKQFVQELNGLYASALGLQGNPGWIVAAKSPAGIVPTGQTIKELLVNLLGGSFGLDHIVVTMPEHSSNVELAPPIRLLDHMGRRV